MRVATHFMLWTLGLARPETQTSDAERACLARHAAGRRRLAEIGVWHGVTTARLRAVMAPDALLLAVDPFPPGRLGFSMQESIARREVARVHNGTVLWVKGVSSDALRALSGRGEAAVDFVFIDGDHSYEGLRADWEAWSPLLRKGGVIGLHDSRSSAARAIDDAGSVRFTRERIRTDSRFTLVDAVDTLTVYQRLP